jgi:hypothetical protein
MPRTPGAVSRHLNTSDLEVAADVLLQRSVLFATVVVLGGFASSIGAWDFWVVTALVWFQMMQPSPHLRAFITTTKQLFQLLHLVWHEGWSAPWSNRQAMAAIPWFQHGQEGASYNDCAKGTFVGLACLAGALKFVRVPILMTLALFRFIASVLNTPANLAERNLRYGLCLVYAVAIVGNVSSTCAAIAAAQEVAHDDNWVPQRRIQQASLAPEGV